MLTDRKQPKKNAVIYDGECNFCIGQIDKIKALDTGSEFEYVPRQDPDVESRFPVLKEGDFNTGMRVVLADGTAFVGADALYQIGKRLPKTRSIAWLYQVPVFKQIAKLIYSIIAANRQKLSAACKTGSCELP